MNARETSRGSIGGTAREVAQPTVNLPTTAIFVDETGRKWRRARRAGWAVAAFVGLYFVLLVAGVARAPWVPHLALPGVGNVLPATGPRLPPALGPEAAVAPAPNLTVPAGPGSSSITAPVPTGPALPGAPPSSLNPQVTVPGSTPPSPTAPTLPTPSTNAPPGRPTPSSVVPPGNPDRTTPTRGRGRP